MVAVRVAPLMVRLEKFNDHLKALISILIASLKPSNIMQSKQIWFRRVEQPLILSKEIGRNSENKQILKESAFQRIVCRQ